jgi:hypothetical protein
LTDKGDGRFSLEDVAQRLGAPKATLNDYRLVADAVPGALTTPQRRYGSCLRDTVRRGFWGFDVNDVIAQTGLHGEMVLAASVAPDEGTFPVQIRQLANDLMQLSTSTTQSV